MVLLPTLIRNMKKESKKRRDLMTITQQEGTENKIIDLSAFNEKNLKHANKMIFWIYDVEIQCGFNERDEDGMLVAAPWLMAINERAFQEKMLLKAVHACVRKGGF